MSGTFLIDIGNSALKWAAISTPQNTGVMVYSDPIELAEQVRDFYQKQRPELIYACTVADARVAATLNAVCHRTRVEWLGSQRIFRGRFTLENRYEDYSKLGADRWYAAIGAAAKHPGTSLLVIQMGTALTADSIHCLGESRYEYLGGRIAPGPTMMCTMLMSGAARLKSIAPGSLSRFPLNTNDAVTTGIFDCIEGFMRGGLASLGEDASVKLVVTGGAARFFEFEIRERFPRAVFDDNLVITGLAARVASEAEKEH